MRILRALGAATTLMAAALSVTAATTNFPNPPSEPSAPAAKKATAVLAGGCFWGMEAVYRHLKGVTNVTSGYAGGNKNDAQYEIVSSGQTGHAEAVKIVYDPAQISYGQLLKVFFAAAHDPTTLNRQGNDEGRQYRSAIFYSDDEQKKIADEYIKELNDAKVYRSSIVTQVVPLQGFYSAEEHHQDFVARNPNYPYVVYVDLPKLHHVKEQFPDLYKGK